MSPLTPTNSPPTDIKICAVDAIRVLKLIPITSIQLLTFVKWAEAVIIYLENLPGSTLHVALNDYLPEDENIFLKNCPESITERTISDLSQQLPKSDEGQDFLSNYNNKF